MKKLATMLICALLLLSACQQQAPGKGKIIRYDLPYPVLNLDPQLATDPYSRMIISNIYEGLMTRDENGELTLGVAESFTLSSDKKTYSFILRKDAEWKDGNHVTAHDFVFTFRRMFMPGSPSPFAHDYIAIENAEELMADTVLPTALGVVAKSDHELEIKLEHPSPFFPALLAETPAMPCNQEIFDNAWGRYGLEKDLVASNGPFYLNRWDNETTIRLLPNPDYDSSRPAYAGGVYFRVEPEQSPMARLLDGSSDVAELSYDDAEKIRAQGYNLIEFQDTVWCIVFNQKSVLWGNPLLRQGLAYAVERNLLTENLPKKLTSTNLLVPPSSTLADRGYRDAVAASPISFDPVQGRKLFEMGMSALSIDSVTNAAFYVPDSSEHMLAMSVVQQSWQKHLSAYLNITSVPLEDIERRFLTGEYDIMLVPVTFDMPFAADFLASFKSGSKYNHMGYLNELYDLRVSEIARAESIEEAGAVCATAESMLLQDAVAIPVYFETSVFATIPSLKGIEATPYPSNLHFKYIEK